MADCEERRTWEVDPSRLKIKQAVNAGATSEVHIADLDGHWVAVKQIDWHNSQMGVMEQRAFNREVGVLAKVEHPNLVRLLGVMSGTKPLRIIVELCRGGSLFDLLHTRHVEVPEITVLQKIKMATDVARGMEYLHSHEPMIMHRDLKSPNLLLAQPVRLPTDVPFVKVADFGLARIKGMGLNQQQVLEGPGGEVVWGKLTVAVGTTHWMAPEVIEGSPYDEKVDVYSYGMCLFEIASRSIPYEDLMEQVADLPQLIMRGVKPSLDEIPPDCPQAFKDLLRLCWARNAAKRASFSQVLQILELCTPQ